MSMNKETGKYSQSSLPKVSFNLKNESHKRLREMQGKLKKLTGGEEWTTTETILFAIDYAHKSLIEYDRRSETD